MADIGTAPRQPDTAVQALDRLAGTWRISGDATGTVRYRWLPGGFFLVQEGELELFGHTNTFTEIIGRHRPFGGEPSAEIHSRAYTSEGDTLDYVYELDGDTLTIWGGQRGSDPRRTIELPLTTAGRRGYSPRCQEGRRQAGGTSAVERQRGRSATPGQRTLQPGCPGPGSSICA